MSTILTDRDKDVLVVTINRPEVRNAIDIATSKVLLGAFEEYERDDRASRPQHAGPVPSRLVPRSARVRHIHGRSITESRAGGWVAWSSVAPRASA